MTTCSSDHLAGERRATRRNGDPVLAESTSRPNRSGPLSVEYGPITSLIPYARNTRTQSDRQVAEIAASIREFGWTNPILIDDVSAS